MHQLAKGRRSLALLAAVAAATALALEPAVAQAGAGSADPGAPAVYQGPASLGQARLDLANMAALIASKTGLRQLTAPAAKILAQATRYGAAHLTTGPCLSIRV